MRPLKKLVIATLVFGVTLTTAHAYTEAEQRQLHEIAARGFDVTYGAKIDGATITARGGRLLKGKDACDFSRLLNAIDTCEISAIVLSLGEVGIDSIYYFPPENIGHVNMEDSADDVGSQIDEIWEIYVEGAKAQSDRLGFEVLPLKWVLYPTLNKTSGVMTYGVLINFGGDHVINLTTVKFTRSGYVAMEVVTGDEILAANSTTYDEVSVYASNTYAPGLGLRYADFQSGDKVATIGAVGVLTSLVGVKYTNKGTLAAIGAAITGICEKALVLGLIIPAAIWG